MIMTAWRDFGETHGHRRPMPPVDRLTVDKMSTKVMARTRRARTRRQSIVPWSHSPDTPRTCFARGRTKDEAKRKGHEQADADRHWSAKVFDSDARPPTRWPTRRMVSQAGPSRRIAQDSSIRAARQASVGAERSPTAAIRQRANEPRKTAETKFLRPMYPTVREMIADRGQMPFVQPLGPANCAPLPGATPPASVLWPPRVFDDATYLLLRGQGIHEVLSLKRGLDMQIGNSLGVWCARRLGAAPCLSPRGQRGLARQADFRFQSSIRCNNYADQGRGADRP